jgi:hypothetical protein
MLRKLIQRIARLAVITIVFPVAGFAQSGPQNLNFESGNEGDIPQGWKATTPRGEANAGYSVKLTRAQGEESLYHRRPCHQLR